MSKRALSFEVWDIISQDDHSSVRRRGVIRIICAIQPLRLVSPRVPVHDISTVNIPLVHFVNNNSPVVAATWPTCGTNCNLWSQKVVCCCCNFTKVHLDTLRAGSIGKKSHTDICPGVCNPNGLSIDFSKIVMPPCTISMCSGNRLGRKQTKK